MEAQKAVDFDTADHIRLFQYVGYDSAHIFTEWNERAYRSLFFDMIPIDACQCDVGVLRGQLLEREADDGRSIVAHAELKEKRVPSTCLPP